MNPKELIADLEAALHHGESHDWRLPAPLVLDALKSMQAERMRPMSEAPPDERWVQAWLANKHDGYWPEQVYWWGDREGGGVWIDEDGEEIDAAGLRCFSGWTPAFRPLEPDELAPQNAHRNRAALLAEIERLTAERDDLRADAWAMICDATNDQDAAARNRAHADRDCRKANRLVEDLRAELVKAGESIRAYERMIDGVAEKASALACEEVKAEFMRRDTIERLQAAEIEALKNELARLTTPRPIEEAPKDGTWVLGLWEDATRAPVVMRYDSESGLWMDESGDRYMRPAHFLPLPVKP